MKINKKILSIPPYLSTTWEHVASLRLMNTDLLITLKSGETIIIPNLQPSALESIFNYHVAFMEDEDKPAGRSAVSFPKVGEKPHADHAIFEQDPNAEGIFKLGLGNAEGLGIAMQHNPELAHAPDLPKEMLDKIGAIAKIVSTEEMPIPKAEPHCNCPYCQIARAVYCASFSVCEEKTEEEIVREEDLQFQEWEIVQSGDKLFTVINKLDFQEKYSVYLGHPVGCTCGKTGCEHILAVLKS